MTKFTKEILEKVVDLGKLNYPVTKCVNVLELKGVEADDFEADFFNPESSVAYNYQAGVDCADFEIDTKILQLAKSGDLKAIEKHEARCRLHFERKKREEMMFRRVENTKK